MTSAFYMAWRFLDHHRLRTALLVLALAITLFLPAAVRLLVRHYDRDLTARAHATPLVVGAKGSRFDLVLAGLYFRVPSLDPVPAGQVDAIRDLAAAIPIHARFTARGRPLVGTSLGYFPFRHLRVARGRLPALLGEAVLGAAVARDLGLGPGDVITTDQDDLYDITALYPLVLQVVGVLGEAGTPDDEVVFVDVKTAWVVEGIGHGHDRVLPSAADLRRADGQAVADDSLVQAASMGADNLATFHFHGDPAEFPLTAILAIPRDGDAKSATLLRGRYDVSEAVQALAPSETVTELMGLVLRIQTFLDAIGALVGLATLLFVTLVVGLSLRARRREVETLHLIGCSPGSVLALLVAEWTLIAALAVAITAAALAVLLALAPALMELV